ncbi:hypothetical protein H1R20_g11810, partial [Candolleomyces eurysporus]
MSHQSPSRPPRYSTLSLAPIPVYPNAAELEIDTDSIVSRNDHSREAFEFCLESSFSSASSRHAWATLRLWSVVPRSSQRPRYISGENVEGSVILDLKRPQMIHSVVVLDKEGRTHPTPQTVLQRGINANVMYEVVVKINSGLLHTKQRINANVLYVPVLRAPPLPVLRASAYFNGASSLVGPVEDRRGWFALPPSYFRVSTTKDITSSTTDIKCTAFIANPAAYTRGTVIPCHLICELLGEDPFGQYTGSSSILNLLTSRKSPISLRLLQNVRYSQDPQRIAPTGRFVKAGQSSQDKEERTVHLKEVGEAVWWKPVSNTAPSPATPGKSSLEGEIHLDAGLLPSTDVPFLEVSVSRNSMLELLVANVELLF